MAEMPRLGKRYEITEVAQVHFQLSSITIDMIISNDYTNKIIGRVIRTRVRTVDRTATALRDDVLPEASSEDFADNAVTMIRHDGTTQPSIRAMNGAKDERNH